VIRVGFTGTRAGCTPEQLAALRKVLEELVPFELHHGDCIGADAEAHQIALDLHQRIVIHPGIYAKDGSSPTRAHCKGANFVLAPMTMFARNREIVDDTEVLVGTPRLMTEEELGGTWHTINHARKKSEPRYIVWPNGSVTKEPA
jgi:hypothetical protein